MVRNAFRFSLASASILAGLAGTAFAASIPAASPLVGHVDDYATIALPADVSGALRHATDQGRLDDTTALPHVWLGLKRPEARQAALDALVRDQQNRASPEYHHWLKPADLRGYGPAQADIDAATDWLTRHGLHVNSVSPSGMAIDFAGTAGDVRAAFGTELHNVTVRGESHVANISPPRIPAALAPVITGVTLHNFFGHPAMRQVTPSLTSKTPQGTFYAVAPADFYKIYNVTPLFSGQNGYGVPITGKGVTIGLVEQTTIQDSDWRHFRRAFGLDSYAGTLKQTHPAGCTDPGATPDEGEAALDAEWSSSTAPDAAIVLASCAGTPPINFGVETTLQALVEHGTSATILSISYEADEAEAGYTFIQGWTNLLEEGASQGIAIFVASGDNGTSADRNEIDSDGLFVNGLADSAYNVSVGGTDFLDGARGTYSQYWSSQDGKYKESALSYVPEIPWDNSCASKILWQFEMAGSASALCNSSFAGVQNGVGGSGSQSVYYSKPSWQLTSIPGVPNDGVRDQPDVSLFAANGIWGHFYVYCMSDANEGGAPCNYSPSGIFNNAAGGTSFGSPAFAGIAALIQQTQGGALGNVAPQLYSIAKSQFSTSQGLANCNSTLGKGIGAACVFNVVTAGNNAEACNAGTPDCKTINGQPIGVLVPNKGYKAAAAYPAFPGYSLATGLGTVNVANLLYNYGE